MPCYKRRVRTLVVAAYAPELAGLAGRDDVVARAVGIGLVAAAAGAERAIAETRPARLIAVGSAGALPGSGLGVGAVAVVARARLAVRPGEYLPGPMTASVEADAALAAACAARLGVPQATVVCPLGITASDAEAARLAAEGAELEHLEAFAVLAAAARAAVPATALLAVANRVGKDAAAEWRAHRVEAEAAAVAALSRLLQGA